MYSWQDVDWSFEKYSYPQQTALSDVKDGWILGQIWQNFILKGPINNTVLRNSLAENGQQAMFNQEEENKWFIHT